MFTAYFDDSGTTDTGVIVVSGWISRLEQWERFDKDWRFVLEKFNLPYFHMKSLRQHKGPFAKFKDDRRAEIDLMERLQRVIRIRAEKSFGCLVDVGAYNSVNREFCLRERFGHPFSFAGCTAIAKTRRWMELAHPHDSTAFVFEAGTKGWGDLIRAAKSEFDVTPVSGDWAKQTPLQAADFVAWENHRAYQQAKAVAYGRCRFRGSFTRFIQQHGGKDWYVADEAQIRAFCRDDLNNGENSTDGRLA